MKKALLSIAAICLLAISLTSCSNNSPKASADKFLTSLYHMEYAKAKEVATDDTKKLLDMMEQFSSVLPDSSKQSAKKIKVDIKDVKEEGDKATVTYVTSESPNEQKLDMIKQNGKWLVQWSKQDGGNDMNDMPADEPVMDDSTGAEPAPVEGATPAENTEGTAH
jgi:uncharacterized protein YxeA